MFTKILCFALFIGTTLTLPTLDHEHETVTQELRKIANYWRELKSATNRNHHHTDSSSMRKIADFVSTLEELERKIYEESLEKAESLNIDTDSCLEDESFLDLYATVDVIAHICKNNLTVKNEPFFSLSRRLKSLIKETTRCMGRKDEKCIHSNFAELEKLAEGELGFFSPEYKEYLMDSINFIYEGNSECLKNLTEQDNFIRQGALKEGNDKNECIKKKINHD